MSEVVTRSKKKHVRFGPLKPCDSLSVDQKRAAAQAYLKAKHGDKQKVMDRLIHDFALQGWQVSNSSIHRWVKTIDSDLTNEQIDTRLEFKKGRPPAIDKKGKVAAVERFTSISLNDKHALKKERNKLWVEEAKTTATRRGKILRAAGYTRTKVDSKSLRVKTSSHLVTPLLCGCVCLVVIYWVCVHLDCEKDFS
jgi:hypothetical protein